MRSMDKTYFMEDAKVDGRDPRAMPKTCADPLEQIVNARMWECYRYVRSKLAVK